VDQKLHGEKMKYDLATGECFAYEMKDLGFKQNQTVWIPAKINDITGHPSGGSPKVSLSIESDFGLTFLSYTPEQVRRYLKRGKK
jgi:hypothetical protein